MIYWFYLTNYCLFAVVDFGLKRFHFLFFTNICKHWENESKNIEFQTFTWGFGILSLSARDDEKPLCLGEKAAIKTVFPWQRSSYIYICIYGGFLKWWYPTTMGFPTKNYHFGLFWGYHHFGKHPYIYILLYIETQANIYEKRQTRYHTRNIHLVYWKQQAPETLRGKIGEGASFESSERMLWAREACVSPKVSPYHRVINHHYSLIWHHSS